MRAEHLLSIITKSEPIGNDLVPSKAVLTAWLTILKQSFLCCLPRLGNRELILVLFIRLFDLCLFGFMDSSSSSCLGRAAVCNCGTPWTFLLPFIVICVALWLLAAYFHVYPVRRTLMSHVFSIGLGFVFLCLLNGHSFCNLFVFTTAGDTAVRRPQNVSSYLSKECFIYISGRCDYFVHNEISESYIRVTDEAPLIETT